MLIIYVKRANENFIVTLSNYVCARLFKKFSKIFHEHLSISNFTRWKKRRN